ncbi:hypothetical protein QCA50_007648 [Cerrena zonata]|uniref:Uncharacterized protein n=1 Tax=Cerrena zonata TaxID=2478898 RepID=A0AAW0G945_9APHY
MTPSRTRPWPHLYHVNPPPDPTLSWILAQEILTFVAPFIYTFTAVRINLPQLFPLDFPELREVMIQADIGPDFLTKSCTSPQLERMLISGVVYQAMPGKGSVILPKEHLSDIFARITPQLTHLCLLEVEGEDDTSYIEQLNNLWSFIERNQGCVGQARHQELQSGKDVFFAPNFLVQEYVSRPMGGYNNPRYGVEPRRYMRLRPYFSQYYSSSFEMHWLDRIEGDNGPWEEEEVEEW